MLGAEDETPVEPVMTTDTQTFFREELEARGFKGGTIDPMLWAELMEKRETAKEDARFKAYEKRRRDRLLYRLKLWIPVGTVVMSALGFGGYQVAKEDPTATDNDDVKLTVETQAAREREETREQALVNAENIETVAGMIVESQEVSVEGFQYLGDKIDTAHPRQADDVEKPAVLIDAERDVAERKRKAKVGALLRELPEPHE